MVFAGEQVIDELAHAAKMDPVAFRIQNVIQGNDCAKGEHHDELLAVLNAVAKAAKWQPRVSASNLSDANIVAAAVSLGQTYTTRLTNGANGGDRRRRGKQEDRQGHGKARLPGAARGPCR